MRKIVVWGTGRWYQAHKKQLYIPGLAVEFLVDKQTEKQGQFLDGWMIKAPYVVLSEHDLDIVIAVKNYGEVIEELEELGFKGNIYLIHELLTEYIACNKDEILRNLPMPENTGKSKPEIIMDIMDGLGWAGSEIWSYQVADILDNRGYDVVVWGDCSQQRLSSNFEKRTYRFARKEDFLVTFLEEVAQKLPCCYFSSFLGKGLECAIIAKRIFGEQFKLIQVIHCDLDWIYEKLPSLGSVVDEFVCVSSKIQRMCEEKNGFESNKISAHLISYTVNDNLEKTYSLCKSQPIKIGWAGRLEKSQKRAEKLVTIIDELEENVGNYELHIAGTGECYSDIHHFIEMHSLQKKVILRGMIPHEQMKSFWEELDVYLNTSLYEGCSLAMLEAMSYGCVPVVTNVSGVSDVIKHGINGIVTEIDNFKDIVQGIKKLEMDRNLLTEYGEKTVKQIMEKCNTEKFSNYLENVINR